MDFQCVQEPAQDIRLAEKRYPWGSGCIFYWNKPVQGGVRKYKVCVRYMLNSANVFGWGKSERPASLLGESSCCRL